MFKQSGNTANVRLQSVTKGQSGSTNPNVTSVKDSFNPPCGESFYEDDDLISSTLINFKERSRTSYSPRCAQSTLENRENCGSSIVKFKFRTTDNTSARNIPNTPSVSVGLSSTSKPRLLKDCTPGIERPDNVKLEDTCAYSDLCDEQPRTDRNFLQSEHNYEPRAIFSDFKSEIKATWDTFSTPVHTNTSNSLNDMPFDGLDPNIFDSEEDKKSGCGSAESSFINKSLISSTQNCALPSPGKVHSIKVSEI